jgi:hypothetical protein
VRKQRRDHETEHHVVQADRHLTDFSELRVAGGHLVNTTALLETRNQDCQVDNQPRYPDFGKDLRVTVILNPAVATAKTGHGPQPQPIAEKEGVPKQMICAAVGNCWQ